MRFLQRFLALILIVFFTVPGNLAAPPAQAAPPPLTLDPATNLSTYYPQTGHNVSYEIKQFYDAHGGVEVFGLPLTEVISETVVIQQPVDVQETVAVTTTTPLTSTGSPSTTVTAPRTQAKLVTTGLRVQYFERARFEIHPELPPEHYISLTRLGALMSEGNTHPAFNWQSGTTDPQRDFFPESGHTLGGAFRFYWQTHGGLTIFGYPISEEFEEINPIDGQSYLVQYFERAKFEYHPEHQGTPHEVQVGLLGKELLQQHPQAAEWQKPALPIKLLGEATTGYAASINERVHNIGRATDMFNGIIVPQNTEFSFNAIGDFTAENGFVNGYAIIGGRLEEVVAGGLCQVSTTMFRAVSNAGLKITHRVGHTFIVNFYENILGFDATVYDPGVDFRWYNDTSGPVRLYSQSSPANATVTFWVWGYDDGRTVSYEGPYTSNWVEPGPAEWEYDPTMAPGAVVQLVHGRSGVDVSYLRTVTLPDGTILHDDNFYTHYQPWADFYVYGPGVFEDESDDSNDGDNGDDSDDKNNSDDQDDDG